MSGRQRELQVLGNTRCLKTPTAMLPFYRWSEREVILLDSGAEQDSSVADYFSGQGLRVSAVLLTHGHIDHIGGIPALRERFGTAVYLPELERQEAPVPVPDSSPQARAPARYAAQQCRVTPDVLIPGTALSLTVENAVFEIIPCPGHTRGHVAYVTPDGVCYLGDLLASSNYLSAVKLLYMHSQREDRHSKEHIRTRSFPCCIAAHRGVISGEQIPELVDRNLAHLENTRQTILVQMGPGREERELIAAVEKALRLSPASALDAQVNFCCIKSGLEELESSGQVRKECRNGQTWYVRIMPI